MKYNLILPLLFFSLSSHSLTVKGTHSRELLSSRTTEKGNIYFVRCKIEDTQDCILIGEGAFSPKQLKSRIKKEIIHTRLEGAAVILSAVGGGIFAGLICVIGSPLAVSSAVIALWSGSGAVLFSSFIYTIESIWTGPIEHKRRVQLTESLLNNSTIKVENLDKSISRLLELLSTLSADEKGIII